MLCGPRAVVEPRRVQCASRDALSTVVARRNMRNGGSRNIDAISNINGCGRIRVGVARLKGDCSAIVPESRGLE